MQRNPFRTEALEPDSPFCNRTQELAELTRDACNGMNVVLFGPRRFGKTSLVRRVQDRLHREHGFCIIYCQFFKVFSVDDLVDRFARAIVAGLHAHTSLLDKGRRLLAHFPSFQVKFGLKPDGSTSIGVEAVQRKLDPIARLESLLADIDRLLDNESFSVCFALDEFQDIVELQEPRVEAILREYIQRQRASYIFLGSRRRVLQDMFSNAARPFYQSAKMMELAPLPADELTVFIQEQFAAAGRQCSGESAAAIVSHAGRYPYYAQALAYRAFELCEGSCSLQAVDTAFEALLENERYGYQATVQALSASQMRLLRALAHEPALQITASAFLQQYALTLGGTQHARKHLETLDLIEQSKEGWRVVDPVFTEWLKRSF